MLLLIMSGKTPYSKIVIFSLLIKKAFRVLFSQGYIFIRYTENSGDKKVLADICSVVTAPKQSASDVTDRKNDT
ncbi:hypothetical protein NLN82_26415 [Citrobacter portucalensis]|uniref:hypothetical protein n=1 Tax=Citrobacter portucalensis TaxID=1639133 RepID=UPI00226B37E4|nr:hypothetical protein [Citrobacter portucalensis]MCX9039541.1 hypothetical protein [Citrobacter portucalensis]